jgi:hypothetical protein
MKRMLPLSLIAAVALLLLQSTAGVQAATPPQASQATPATQPVIVAWDRVGTPA